MRRGFALTSLVLALVGAAPGHAQQQSITPTGPLSQGSVVSPVLTIDRERVFRDSAFGQRVAAEDQERLTELAAENRQIEAALAAEEQVLTKKRPTMDPNEFRALADAFDRKVQETEKSQGAKERALTELLDKEREVFLKAAAPVLEQLMRESGAVVILERRSVFVSVSAVEITDEAIALLDETIGSGPEAD